MYTFFVTIPYQTISIYSYMWKSFDYPAGLIIYMFSAININATQNKLYKTSDKKLEL